MLWVGGGERGRQQEIAERTRRSGAWVKVKVTLQQELVFGGYTPPEGNRKYFDGLLAGYQGTTPAVMKRCSSVESVLVAQIKFTEWTLDDQLRQPVFLGLRSDKRPKEVVRE